MHLLGIVAISVHGILHYKLVDGAANGTIFREFLDELQPYLPHNVVIVMDNVRFHHCHLVQEWAADHQQAVRVEYLPPYSPELNPIEEFFHMEKVAYRKANKPIARTREVMRARVTAVYEQLRLRELSGLYRHMRQFLAVAYAGQPFL
jgi:transposase